MLFHTRENRGCEHRLSPFVLVDISSLDVSKYAEKLLTSSSCVIKAIEPQVSAKVDDLKSVVLKVNSLEEAKQVPPWDEEHIPEEIVPVKPNPG